jgi:hypothetical protein
MWANLGENFRRSGEILFQQQSIAAIQIATWNDYEEGTAIEPGIDNCI